MPGYRFGCAFSALPEFYTEGKDLTLLDVFRSQGFQPNDRGLAIIQNRSLIGFSRETEIHGRYRGRPAALYFGRGRYNQIAFTWPSHGFFRDPTPKATAFLDLFRAVTALPDAWDVVEGSREDFTMSITGNRAYLNGPYPLFWLSQDWVARIGLDTIRATPHATVEASGDGWLVIFAEGVAMDPIRWKEFLVPTVRAQWGLQHFFVPSAADLKAVITARPLTPAQSALLTEALNEYVLRGWTFTRDDVVRLDARLSAQTSEDDRAEAGILLGEAIRRAVPGASWAVVRPWGLPGITGLAGPVPTTIPRAKVDKRCEAGSIDNLVFYYDLVTGRRQPET